MYAKDLRDANQLLYERTKELDEQRARKTPVNTWDVVKDASVKKLMDEKEEIENQLQRAENQNDFQVKRFGLLLNEHNTVKKSLKITEF